MAKANQRGEWMVRFFIILFVIACPVIVFIESMGSVIYSQFVYGHIEIDVLYRPYRLEYV